MTRDDDHSSDAGSSVRASDSGERHHGDGSPRPGESKYPSTSPGRPNPAPLHVRIELVVIDSPDAKELLRRQAAAVRGALEWFAAHPRQETER